MKVLVFEQWHGGHHFNYLECILPRLAKMVDRVEIHVTNRTFQSPDFRTQLRSAHALPNVDFKPVLPEISPALAPRDRIQASRNLVQSMKSARPDMTLIPSADAPAMALAFANCAFVNLLKRLGPVEGTFHTGYGNVRKMKHRAKESVYSLVYRRVPLTAINFVNANYYEFIRGRGFASSSRMKLVGDPVVQPARIGREAARRLLGIPLEGRYLGILGSLDPRKAIPDLLAAFRAAHLVDSDRLLLAGRLAPSFAELIDREYGDLVKSGRLVVLNRFLTEEELLHGYEALDLATIAYYDFPGLASLALKAIAAGRPVIGHDLGWFGMIVKRFDNGAVVNIYDTAAFAEALRKALDRSASYVETEGIRRLLAFHRVSNFVDNMLENVGAMSGHARQGPACTWDSVMEALPPERRHQS
jgi:glycosyltransferase involved in cell wall biosynthesis